MCYLSHGFADNEKSLDLCDQYLFSCSVVSDSLRPRGLQHTRLPCPSPTPGVYPNSCPSRWWHPTILVSHSLLLPPSIIPSIKVSSHESVVRIKWPEYWSFSFNINPSNEHPGLIILSDELVGSPCSPKDSQESSPTPQFKSINSSALLSFKADSSDKSHLIMY